jgi:hypothetical protein
MTSPPQTATTRPQNLVALIFYRARGKGGLVKEKQRQGKYFQKPLPRGRKFRHRARLEKSNSNYFLPDHFFLDSDSPTTPRHPPYEIFNNRSCLYPNPQNRTTATTMPSGNFSVHPLYYHKGVGVAAVLLL